MGPTVGRRQLIAAIGGTMTAYAFQAGAKPPSIARVGVLVVRDADAERLGGDLREGLRDRGYREGENIRYEFRSASGETGRLGGLAEDLVRSGADVIVAMYTPCALAAKRATSSIPIVAAAVGDPVGTGLVTSLAKPGGNVTGVSNMAAETAGKGVEVLAELLPSLHRVAALANPDDPFTKPFLAEIERTGRTAGIEIHPVVMATDVEQVDAAFATIASEQADAVIVQGLFFSKTVADLAIKHRLPTASVLRSYADAGGLVSYGAHLPALVRRCAVLVDRILNGTPPAELPVEQPTRFELIVNLKTAKALGLTVPPSLLARADEVIE